MTPLLMALIAIPAGGAAIVAGSASREMAERIAGVTALLFLILASATAMVVLEEGPVGAFAGVLRVDALSAIELVLAGIVALAVVLGSAWELGEAERAAELSLARVRRLHTGSLGLLAAAALVFVSGHLALLWLGLSLAAVAATQIIAGGAGSQQARATAAAWSYAVQCVAGLGLMLVGMALLDAAGGVGGTLMWSELSRIAGGLDQAVARLGVLLFLLGAATAAGLAPMHLWLGPAHADAPPAAASLLSTTLVGTALYTLIRMRSIAATTLPDAGFAQLFTAVGVMTLLAAAIATWSAPTLRLLLAGSTLTWLGLSAFALGLGAGTLSAVLALTIGHTLVATLAFLAAGDVGRYFGGDDLARLGGALAARPTAAGGLLFALFALAGLPPTGMFSATLAVFEQGFASGRTLTSVAALALAFVAALPLLGAAQTLVTAPDKGTMPRSRRGSRLTVAVIGVLVLLALAMGTVVPGSVVRLVTESTRALGPETRQPFTEPDSDTEPATQTDAMPAAESQRDTHEDTRNDAEPSVTPAAPDLPIPDLPIQNTPAAAGGGR